ncbi:MAG: hypothetical protein ABR964_05500 [Tepidisphaeraceae bacterium]|jgi:hypothetical protein
MRPEIEASWEKLLNPDSLKQQLLAGGIYLAAYEMFKRSLVRRPRDFFWSGLANGKDVVDPKYQIEVVSLDKKHIYHASALWWERQGVLTADDVLLTETIREHRDEIAHDIPRFLGTADGVIRLDLLSGILATLSKIDKWWIQQVEIPANPDFDGITEEELDGAASLSMVFLSIMIPIASGDDSGLREIYRLWKERKTANGQRTS